MNYDYGKSKVFFSHLYTYGKTLNDALKQLFNPILKSDYDIALKCISDNLSSYHERELFGNPRYRFSFWNNRNKKLSLKDKTELFLKEVNSFDTQKRKEFIDYAISLSDFAMYLKYLDSDSIGFIDLCEDKIGIDIIGNKSIFRNARNVRNDCSHETDDAIKRFNSASTMYNALNSYNELFLVFKDIDCIKMYEDELNKKYQRGLRIIESTPLLYEDIKAISSYYSDEQLLIDDFSDAYDISKHVLYGYTKNEIEEKVRLRLDNLKKYAENNVDIVKGESFPKLEDKDEVIESLFAYDNYFTSSQIREIGKKCIVLLDTKSFTTKSYRTCVDDELLIPLQKDSRMAIVNYSSRLNLNRRSVNGEIEEKEDARKARDILDYLMQIGKIKYSNRSNNLYEDGILEMIDLANKNKDYRFFIVTNDSKSEKEIYLNTNNCLVARVFPKIIQNEFINKLAISEMFKDNIYTFALYHEEEIVDKKDYEVVVSSNKNKTFFVEGKTTNKTILYTANKEEVILKKVLNNMGSEGIIYEVDDKYVAKIYKDKHLTNKEEKLKLMLKNKIENNKLCWPIALLYDSNNKFVGYLMPKVNSNYLTLGRSILSLLNKTLVKNTKGLDKWDRKSLVSLCSNLANCFASLHENNIIVGDINQNNILIDVSDNTGNSFYLVDLDSLQIGPYPCPVGMIAFTSPKIFKRFGTSDLKYNEFLRTIEDDEYALASLLFQILMFKKLPFEGLENDEIDIEQLKEYHFSYLNGIDIPHGPYALIWENMPDYIKEAFIKVFTGKGTIKAKEFNILFNRYAKDIEEDKYSSELLPRLYKDGDDVAYFNCEICGKCSNLKKDRYLNLIKQNDVLSCAECEWKYIPILKEKTITLKCEKCSRNIEVSMFDKLRYDKKTLGYEHILCKECKE